MISLPVRELVLYKSGIGFFVRAGQTTENTLRLNFRVDEINDALKSLAVIDQAGGHVVSVGYETPMDVNQRRNLSSIRLSDTHSLRDLIVSLRGRMVSLQMDLVGESVEMRGRMIGLQEAPVDINRSGDSVIVQTDDGLVHVIPWLSLRGLRLLDERAAHDLGYFLDTSEGDDPRREIVVQLSPLENAAPHDLVVYYSAPSPTWRVSYRVVAQQDEGKETGSLIFQGWGLFDNRLDEDLTDVQVTLVAGQPISFVYDLYSSSIPQRPTVYDEARTAAGPVEYEAAMLDDGGLDSRFDQVVASRAVPPPAMSMMMSALEPKQSKRSRMESARPAPPPVTAEVKDAGEFFEYRVGLPVSVRRGDSALVPILHRETRYTRELLYNGSKLASHPVAALRFTNDSGLTLERGPVTVIENSGYRGDAIVPFTRHGIEVYLPYAVELAVRVTEQASARTENIRFGVVQNEEERFFAWQVHAINERKYTITNASAEPRTVTIEAPTLNMYSEYFDMPKPSAHTDEFDRWQVSVPAKGSAVFMHRQRRKKFEEVQFENLKYEALADAVRKGWLDQALMERLRPLLEKIDTMKKLAERLKTVNTAISRQQSKQAEARQNLTALKDSVDETGFRVRMVAVLNSAQDELEKLSQMQSEIETARLRLSEELDSLLNNLPTMDENR